MAHENPHLMGAGRDTVRVDHTDGCLVADEPVLFKVRQLFKQKLLAVQIK